MSPVLVLPRLRGRCWPPTEPSSRARTERATTPTSSVSLRVRASVRSGQLHRWRSLEPHANSSRLPAPRAISGRPLTMRSLTPLAETGADFAARRRSAMAFKSVAQIVPARWGSDGVSLPAFRLCASGCWHLPRAAKAEARRAGVLAAAIARHRTVATSDSVLGR